MCSHPERMLALADELDIGAATFNLVVATRAIFEEDVDKGGHVVSIDHDAIELPEFGFVELALLKFDPALSDGYAACTTVSIDATKPAKDDWPTPVVGCCDEDA